MSRIDLDNRILEATSVAGTGRTQAPQPSARAVASGPSFGQVLQDQLTAQAAQAGVKFSGHAQTRLASRNISFSGEDIAKLGSAITRAAAKGSRESLMLMDQAALVVSVPNRTVITAVDKSSLKENIFTNIDSAMIL
jgi:flagellar operon protein